MAGFLVPYVIQLDGQVRARFDDLSWQIPSRVLARPLDLAVGRPMTLDVVRRTVDALVDHGRDRWGERKTAMIASMLDRKKLAPPEKMPTMQVEKLDEMALDTASTKTTRVRK